ncbi:Uncharacterized protein HZ326_3713 [Fusarium oxysporum f. sp. albedinis]|nr:Uncharacterized protein HZ326_3713 [Fusarium oxysporum f. sp. albedinis]
MGLCLLQWKTLPVRIASTSSLTCIRTLRRACDKIQSGYHPSGRCVPTVWMPGTAVDLHYRTFAPRKPRISSDL